MIKWVLCIVGAAALLGIGMLYYKYGTLEPCGMLRQKISQEDELAGHLPDALVEAGMKMKYGPLTPGRCLNLLIKRDRNESLNSPEKE
ncbi:MAG: hypothetical protein PHW76_08035 [Alphaproteobacteria bacterium]|nr:hypothetical protein [Alphaproteobacteria bacterium]